MQPSPPAVIEIPEGLFIRHPKVRGRGRVGCLLMALVAGVGGGSALVGSGHPVLGIVMIALGLAGTLGALRSPVPYGITLISDEIRL